LNENDIELIGVQQKSNYYVYFKKGKKYLIKYTHLKCHSYWIKMLIFEILLLLAVFIV